MKKIIEDYNDAVYENIIADLSKELEDFKEVDWNEELNKGQVFMKLVVTGFINGEEVKVGFINEHDKNFKDFEREYLNVSKELFGESFDYEVTTTIKVGDSNDLFIK